MSLSIHAAELLQHHGLQGSIGVVAVSGGPDSIALAHLLRGERVIFAHVNHLLRGAESDGDEVFVQSLPLNWPDCNAKVRTTRIAIAAMAESERENLESVGRRERYAWLAQVAREEGASWVATGHTADDQAETVLFRLLRGAGVTGLRGVAERRPIGDGVTLIRPLLSVRRQALLDYLAENKVAYRVDSSNRDLRFTRNRIRLELLPFLQEKYNVGVVDVLCRLAEQAQEIAAETAAKAERVRAEAELPRAGHMLVFSVLKLRSADANLVREMFRLVWQREAWPMGGMDFAHWQRLVEIAAGVCAANDFPGGIHVQHVGKVLQIRRRSGCV